MHHVVHAFEDVRHQMLLVAIVQGRLLELLLSIEGAEVLLIVEAESVAIV